MLFGRIFRDGFIHVGLFTLATAVLLVIRTDGVLLKRKTNTRQKQRIRWAIGSKDIFQADSPPPLPLAPQPGNLRYLPGAPPRIFRPHRRWAEGWVYKIKHVCNIKQQSPKWSERIVVYQSIFWSSHICSLLNGLGHVHPPHCISFKVAWKVLELLLVLSGVQTGVVSHVWLLVYLVIRAILGGEGDIHTMYIEHHIGGAAKLNWVSEYYAANLRLVLFFFMGFGLVLISLLL